MIRQFAACILTAAAVLATVANVAYAGAQTAAPQNAPTQKGTSMPAHATGPFDVKVTPLPPEDKVGDPSIGRMSIDKQFHGDLEGSSKGQMLTAMSDVKGSAGYVAIERVNATIHTPNGPRTGTFALQHTGIMTRGTPQLTISVVPDSGTGQLTGITGTMNINIADDKHSYDFEYTLLN